MTGNHLNQQPLVVAEGISKNYQRVQALAPLSITVQAGECVALAGPSGSGKTTLLSMLAGMVQPDQGRIFINGRDLSRLNPGKELSQLVRLIHQPAEIFHPILVECSNRLERTSVFIHHMRGAFPHQRVKRGSMPFEIGRLYISQ